VLVGSQGTSRNIFYLNYFMLCVYFDWCYNLLDVNFTTVFITLFIDIKNEYFLPSADVSLKYLNYFLVIFHRCVKFHSV
jgi:hypothetical protein